MPGEDKTKKLRVVLEADASQFKAAMAESGIAMEALNQQTKRNQRTNRSFLRSLVKWTVILAALVGGFYALVRVSNRIRNIYNNLRAKFEQVRTSVQKKVAQYTKLITSLKTAIVSMLAWHGALTAAGVITKAVTYATVALAGAFTAFNVAYGVFVAKGITYGDKMAKLGEILNTTTKSVQILTHAADLAGVEFESLRANVSDFFRRLSQAHAGTGPAVDALKRLNLSAAELFNMPVDRRIETVTDAIKKFIPVAEQAAVAGQLFGEEGALNLQKIDGSRIREATRDIKRFGYALDDVDTAKIELAKDALTKLGLLIKGIQTELALARAPWLVYLIKKLEEGEGQLLSIKKLFDDIFKLFLKIAIAANQFRKSWVWATEGEAHILSLRKELKSAEKELKRLKVAQDFMTKHADMRLEQDIKHTLKRIPELEQKIVDLKQLLADTGAIPEGSVSNIVKAMEAEVNALAKTFEDEADKRRKKRKVVPTGLTKNEIGKKSLEAQAEIEAAKTRNLAKELATREQIIRSFGQAELDILEAKALTAIEEETNVYEKRRKLLELQNHMARENQINAYALQIEDLANARSEMIITEQTYREKLEQLEELHQSKMALIQAKYESQRNNFAKKSALEKTKTLAGFLSQQVRGLGAANKALFHIEKALAISDAVVATQAAAAKAIAIYGPTPWGYAAAAGALAFGAARVGVIAAQSFGGGGTGGSAGGSTGRGGINEREGTNAGFLGGQNQQDRQVLDVRLTAEEGQIFTKRQLAQIIDEINEEAGDGRSINLSLA